MKLHKTPPKFGLRPNLIDGVVSSPAFVFSLELGEAQLGNLQGFVEVVVGPWSPDTFPYFRCGFSSSLCVY